MYSVRMSLEDPDRSGGSSHEAELFLSERICKIFARRVASHRLNVLSAVKSVLEVVAFASEAARAFEKKVAHE